MGSAAIAILVVLGLCSVPASAVQCGAGSSSISETGDITAEMCPEDNTYCEPCDVPPVCMFNIKVACHCKACPSDTHSDGSALVYRNGCIPDTFCGAGERLSSESCISCSANQYQSESRHRKTACALQSYCNAGTYLHGASSATQGTCKACGAQYYQSSNRHFSTSCARCTTACSAGFQPMGCTRTTMNVQARRAAIMAAALTESTSTIATAMLGGTAQTARTTSMNVPASYAAITAAALTESTSTLATAMLGGTEQTARTASMNVPLWIASTAAAKTALTATAASAMLGGAVIIAEPRASVQPV